MLYRDPNNDSAARGLRQAEKGVQFLLREELQEWLEQLGLFDYAMPLFEQGFDDLSVLQSLRPKVRRAASAAATVTLHALLLAVAATVTLHGLLLANVKVHQTVASLPTNI